VGKTQLPKRLIVSKDQAAFYKKVGYDFLEKVAVGSKRQSGSFLEQDSTG
jgi:hypothetical protein